MPELPANLSVSFPVIEHLAQSLSQRAGVTSRSIYTEGTQKLTADGRVKRHYRQGHRHVVAYLARSLGRGELGGDRHITHRQVPRHIVVGNSAGEADVTIQAEAICLGTVAIDARKAHDEEVC